MPYERGELLKPPPAGLTLQVQADGLLGYEGDSLEADQIWYEWGPDSACEHRWGKLLRHRLGNIGLIALLRAELQREPSRFPILLGKVLYSGAHTGDYLPFHLVPALQGEIDALGGFSASTKRAGEFVSHFRAQMAELVTVAQSVSKPIAF